MSLSFCGLIFDVSDKVLETTNTPMETEYIHYEQFFNAFLLSNMLQNGKEYTASDDHHC